MSALRYVDMGDRKMNEKAAKDIRYQKRVLDKLRREESQRAMMEYDEQVYYPAVKQLQQQCEQDGGHVFTFSNFGPTYWKWFYCTLCDKSKSEPPDTGPEDTTQQED